MANERPCDFCDLDGFRTNSEIFLEHALCLYAAAERTGREQLPGSGIIVPKAHVIPRFVDEPGAGLGLRAALLDGAGQARRRAR